MNEKPHPSWWLRRQSTRQFRQLFMHMQIFIFFNFIIAINDHHKYAAQRPVSKTQRRKIKCKLQLNKHIAYAFAITRLSAIVNNNTMLS